MCSKLAASLAHIGAGALRARDAIHDIPPSLREKVVLHVHQRFSKRFRCRVVGVWLSVVILLGRRAGVAVSVEGSQKWSFSNVN